MSKTSGRKVVARKGEDIGKQKWVQIGVVGVDSGQLMIVDPCYVDSQWHTTNRHKMMWKDEGWEPDCMAEAAMSYLKVCNVTRKLTDVIDRKMPKDIGQLNYEKGHAGVAVAFPSGLGDGVYPVFARIEKIDKCGTRMTGVLIDCSPTQVQKKFIKTMWGCNDECKKCGAKYG